jgi:hypothetical protein
LNKSAKEVAKKPTVTAERAACMLSLKVLVRRDLGTTNYWS